MHTGHPVDPGRHFQHQPSPIEGTVHVQTELVKFKHRQLLPLCTQADIGYCVIGVNAQHQ